MINKSKKILFVHGSKAASGYYRMGQIQIKLRQMGFITESVIFESVDPLRLVAYKDIFKGLTPRQVAIDMTKFDIVIFQMVWHDVLLSVINSLKSKGILTAMDVDDDYTCLPSDNPSFYSFHPRARTVREEDGLKIKLLAPKYKQVRNKWIRDRKSEERVNHTLKTMFNTAKTVDILQVSTPELKESYKKFNPNVFVFENCIENEQYKDIAKEINDIPVVAWLGTKTHRADLQLVNGCIPQNCKLLIVGFPEIQGEFFNDINDIEFMPPYKLDDLPNILAKCDIGIVPLVDNKFNAGKSDLKGLEFGAMEIPIVASDVAPYRRWIRDGENGFLAKKNKSKFWIRYIQKLVDDKELREKMGKEAKKDALKRDINNNIDKWIERYFK